MLPAPQAGSPLAERIPIGQLFYVRRILDFRPT